jgi:ChaB/Rho termination factor, N-terminal domain
MPARKELPSTLRRSSKSAQHKWSVIHDAAVEQYGEGERAHRTAFAGLKETHERRGDRWVAKKRGGPSDPRAAQPTTAAKRAGRGKTYFGVSAYQNTKQELYDRARSLGIEGRSRMSKDELAEAIGKRQQSRTRRR